MDCAFIEKLGTTTGAELITAAPESGARVVPLPLPISERTGEIQRALLLSATAGENLGFAVLDIATGVIQVDEGWMERLGFGSDGYDLTLPVWLDRIHPDDRSRVEWVLDSLLIGHAPQGKVECQFRGGDEQWLSLAIFGRTECTPEGAPVRLHLCLRDTTEEHAYLEQLRQLAQRAESQRESDRITLARELHDQLGQWLTAIRMDADRLLVLQNRGITPPASELSSRLTEIKSIASDSIKAVQRICQDLRPVAIAELGLLSTLRGAADAFEARTGIRCRAVLPEREPALDTESCRVLSRAFHEALTNVIRHAQASEVRITLHEEPGSIELEIADNGRGLPPEALCAPTSIGLFGLRERAQGLGGEAIITAAPGGGTLVVLRIPTQAIGGASQAALS